MEVRFNSPMFSELSRIKTIIFRDDSEIIRKEPYLKLVFFIKINFIMTFII